MSQGWWNFKCQGLRLQAAAAEEGGEGEGEEGEGGGFGGVGDGDPEDRVDGSAKIGVAEDDAVFVDSTGFGFEGVGGEKLLEVEGGIGGAGPDECDGRSGPLE